MCQEHIQGGCIWAKKVKNVDPPQHNHEYAPIMYVYVCDDVFMLQLT